jgi:hypothetical protein
MIGRERGRSSSGLPGDARAPDGQDPPGSKPRAPEVASRSASPGPRPAPPSRRRPRAGTAQGPDLVNRVGAGRPGDHSAGRGRPAPTTPPNTNTTRPTSTTPAGRAPRPASPPRARTRPPSCSASAAASAASAASASAAANSSRIVGPGLAPRPSGRRQAPGRGRSGRPKAGSRRAPETGSQRPTEPPKATTGTWETRAKGYSPQKTTQAPGAGNSAQDDHKEQQSHRRQRAPETASSSRRPRGRR